MNITIENDDEDEQYQECFVFDISTSETGVVLATTEATVCINDDDGRDTLM